MKEYDVNSRLEEIDWQKTGHSVHELMEQTDVDVIFITWYKHSPRESDQMFCKKCFTEFSFGKHPLILDINVSLMTIQSPVFILYIFLSITIYIQN